MTSKATDQITLVDITDGYSVMLTSEAYVFPGTTTAATAGSCTTQVVALCGADPATATVDASAVEKPTGITVSVSANSGSPILTISASSSFTAPGDVVIPVVVGEVTISKRFSVGIAFKGSTGSTGPTGAPGADGSDGTSITGFMQKYAINNSSTTAPTTWSTTPIAPTSSNQHLWSYEIVSYSDGSTTSTTPHVIGTWGSTGSTGAAGSVWYTGTGITGTSTTATAFSGSGVSAAKVGDKYLNTSNGNTYDCTVAGAASAAKWAYQGNIRGATGAAGADALVLVVTSSAGNIFKNTSIATALTAHVYKGGTELSASTSPTLASQGTIKWYKDGSTTPCGTGQTLSVSAGDVVNAATYAAVLE